ARQYAFDAGRHCGGTTPYHHVVVAALHDHEPRPRGDVAVQTGKHVTERVAADSGVCYPNVVPVASQHRLQAGWERVLTAYAVARGVAVAQSDNESGLGVRAGSEQEWAQNDKPAKEPFWTDMGDRGL